jgi:hypothetical protein
VRTERTHRSAIGSTQITKSGKFPTWSRGDNITDLYLVVGDDNTVKKGFDQLLPLVKGGVLKTALNALTKIMQMVKTLAEFEMAVGQREQLLGLVVERLALGL